MVDPNFLILIGFLKCIGILLMPNWLVMFFLLKFIEWLFPLPGCPNETVMPEVLNLIDAEMEKNDKLAAPKLGKKLQEQFGINFSESKVAWVGSDWHKILPAEGQGQVSR